MSDNERVRLTLEERLALAAQSKAASSEAAAALVRRFHELPAADIFCGTSDVDAMNNLTGEFWDIPGVDVDSYRGFCPSFLAAMEYDNDFARASWRPEDLDSDRPLLGVRVNNALVLLGEMLLDQTMGRQRRKEIYHSLHMTLQQYLDALTGPAFLRSGSEAEWFTAWREKILEEIDGDQPLAEALSGILRRYMSAWESFDHLDHILHCLAGLALYLEKEGTGYDVSPCSDEGACLVLTASRTEEAKAARRFRMALRKFGIGKDRQELPQADRKCQDPREYLLNLALEYAPDLPDPGSRMEAKTLRSQIFLPCWSCDSDALWELLENPPFPESASILKEGPDRERLNEAMREVNAAVMDLYMLWVEPYLWAGKALNE